MHNLIIHELTELCHKAYFSFYDFHPVSLMCVQYHGGGGGGGGGYDEYHGGLS